MAFYGEIFMEMKDMCSEKNVTLVAVSKTQSVADILSAYQMGQRDFGENYVQELIAKSKELPKDIRWHFIGHLQSNKIKQIALFIYLVQGIDNEKLLQELNRQALKLNRTINCLLQVHIASEETKFGFGEDEVKAIKMDNYPQLNICGLMGMAT